jgi:hypothetical protein
MLGREAQEVVAVVALREQVTRDGLEWRSEVMVEDVERVRALVARTGFFNDPEVELAADLVTERFCKGICSGYDFVLAERGAALAAFACFGPIYGTEGSFELYWIAVSPEEQRQGLRAQAYMRAEAAMIEARARAIYADTSSLERSAPTRDFYRRVFTRRRGLPISTRTATARSST